MQAHCISRYVRICAIKHHLILSYLYPVCEMATVKWGNENVMIVGGADRSYQPFNKVLMYNIKTQKS